MSKRGQTTGLPKANRPAPKPTPPSEPPRGIRPPRLAPEYRSKAERDAGIQRLLILATIIVIGITALVLAIAIIYDQVIVPRQPVATVNEQTITVADFQKRVQLERFLLSQQLNQAVSLFQSFGMDDNTINQQLTTQEPYATWLNELNVPDQLGNRVLNTMIQDELVRQEAAARGVTVGDDVVQEKINDFFGYDPQAGLVEPTATLTPTTSPTPFVSPTPSPAPTSTPEPSATPTPEGDVTPTATLTPFPSATPSSTPDATQRAETFNTTRNDFFGAIRSNTGLSDADINAYFQIQALREALRDSVTEDLSRTAPYVNVRHILVATQEEANDALAALEAGESFAGLAAAISTDQSNATNGGELGWSPPTQYVEAFANAVTEAEIGALVGPVQTEFGYHLIQVRAREDREMSDADYETAKNREFSTFLEDTRTAQNANIQIFDTWADNIPR